MELGGGGGGGLLYILIIRISFVYKRPSVSDKRERISILYN